MEWSDDQDKRRAQIDNAWISTKVDGKARFVVCLPGWPIRTVDPTDDPEVREYAAIRSDGSVLYAQKTKVGEKT